MTLDLALSYAARGWPCFPCRAKEEMDPNTGEFLKEKTPYTSNGFRGASKNERIINEWWRRTPDAMVGIPTGRSINAWVLDVDIKELEDGTIVNGYETLAALEEQHGSLPETARVATPRGGTHYYFNHVEGVRNRGAFGHGIDVRGEGGFVISAGSLMADGREYKWLSEAPLADAPAWLLALVLPPVHTPTRHDYTYTPGGNEPYVERAVEDELRNLATTTQGGRGEQVNKSAYSLGTIVGSGALSRQEAEDGLWRASVSCGVVAKDGEREIRAKIKRGLDAGMRQPREIPERQQDNTRLVDISRMIANGLAKARKAAGEEEIKPEPVSADAETSPQAENAVASTSADANQDTVQDTPPPAIVATPFVYKDPKTLARREFVYGTHYIRKYVSVTSSPGGLGKTSNSIVEALAMGTGRALLGHKPPAPVKVWLFNAEDPRDEMERRIMAACIHYKLTPKDIAGCLFLDTGREQELVVAIDDKKGVRIQAPIVEAVVSQIKSNKIDVMIIDPFVSTHRVNENDNGAIDAVAKLWGKIADETNCAIDVVHHIRKVSDRDATVEDSRGAVSLISAARSARILNQMSADQAKEAGVNPDDRFSYFNVNAGKSNMTVRSGRVDWRRLVSVPLGNGRGLTKPQDHAGVVTEWKWPSAEDLISDGVTEDQMRHITSLLDNGDYKPAANAKNWAGTAVAFAIGLDVDNAGERRRANTIYKALMKEGKIKEVRERDPVSRKETAFVRSVDYAA